MPARWPNALAQNITVFLYTLFFSSRRRHTRFDCDWSSDVCSSDLVVAGIRTPLPISDLQKISPDAFAQLREITTNLEKHYKDMQDFEFTIEDGKLYKIGRASCRERV